MIVKRGDVFYADLDTIIGSEQGGCVTAQDNSLFILQELFFYGTTGKYGAEFMYNYAENYAAKLSGAVTHCPKIPLCLQNR